MDPGSAPRGWEQSDLIRKKKAEMMSRGWCPHHVQYLALTYSPLAFASLASLAPLGGARHHEACQQAAQCIAFNVDMVNYQTKHVRPACDCDLVDVPYETVTSIIQQGGVPLVSIEQSTRSSFNNATRFRLKVQKRHPKTEYVAISHVWADGLGNPGRNALPECQITRLKRQLENLPRLSDQSTVIAFWMDTLCIPVDPRDERLKVQTIHNMASIYTMASSVLILDSGLMTLNCRRLTSGLLAHMICSVWMQRSWTLQEGILAERCVFQFSNKAVMLSRGIASHGRDYSLAWTADLEDGSAREIGGRVEVPRLEEGSGQNGNSLGLGKIFLDSLVQKIISFHPKVEHGMRKDVTLNAARFASIWNALAGRSTTMTGDLYLILANVLNIQTAPLGKLSTTQEKLQHIIFSFPTLPVSLLFNTGEKHADNQNRFNGWLPAELSRDILSSQPTMSFHGSHNVLEFSDLGNGFETYLISSVALLRQSFVVDTESDRPLLNVQVISTSFADREMPNELACIIIEHTKLGSETLTRGACFLISKISYGKYTYRPRVQLIYHAPVRAQRLSATSQTKSSRSKPVFTASEVSDCGLKFWLGYDPIPSFKPLELHAFDQLQKSWKWAMGISYSVLAVIVYIALVFVFAVKIPIYPLNFVICAVLPIVIYYSIFVLDENMAHARSRRYAQRFETTRERTSAVFF